MYKLFLTFRYMTGRMLSVVAMVVLAVAVWVLVVAPSVMSGFQEEFHSRLRGTKSDLTIWSARPFKLTDDPAVEKYLADLPHVKGVAPYLENPALDKKEKAIDYCFVRGIVPEKEEKVTQLRSYILSPREVFMQTEDYKLASPEEKQKIEEDAEKLSDEADPDQVYEYMTHGHPEDADLPTVVVGIYYMKRWDLVIGDLIRLTSASDEGEVNEDQQFKIVGVFRTGHHDTDRRVLITSLPNLQKFLKVEGRLTGYSIALTDYKLADKTKARLAEDIQYRRGRKVPLPKISYYVRTWEERNVNLLRAVRMEKLLIRIMTFLIVIAAAASIFLVLFMTVHTKVRELGILRAVGATRLGVLSVFVGQGFLIAFVAMILGTVLGFVTGENINWLADEVHSLTGWHPFPPEIYYLDEIPVKFDLKDNLINFVVTLALGSVAALVPGSLAAFKPPLKAIRYE